jgi:hypothetical protein
MTHTGGEFEPPPERRGGVPPRSCMKEGVRAQARTVAVTSKGAFMLISGCFSEEEAAV